MQATFNNRILIFSCNFISTSISGFLISSLLEGDLTFSLSEDVASTIQRLKGEKILDWQSVLGGRAPPPHVRACTDVERLWAHPLQLCQHNGDRPALGRLVTKLNNFQAHTHPVTGRTVYPVFLIKLKSFI